MEMRGLDDIQKKADQVAADIFGPPFVKAMNDATLIVTRTARQEAKVDTGRHRSHIVPRIEVEKDVIRGIVGTNLEYGPFAILDTRPHWPPIDAVRVWARRHGINAFLVARSIARRGTKGDYSTFKGLEKNASRIMKLFSRVIERMVGK